MSKISTQAYTIKRLRDSGYNVVKLDNLQYTLEDERKWTILIDMGVANILATCYKDGRISLYDGGQFTVNNMAYRAESVEVIIDTLNTLGIYNKHHSYYSRPQTLTVDTLE